MLPPDTPRLHFRQIQPDDDLPQIFKLQSDPVTMAFIRAPDTDFETVVERMQMWAEYQANNPDYGVWMVELADGQFAGYCVLREVEWSAGNDLEIGYVVTPEHWGKGLASEIARALCQYSFAQFPVPKLVAFIDPANGASQRVLEKCGFVPVSLGEMQGLPSLRLELLRTDFVHK